MPPETDKPDVLILGGGPAGLCAAIAARQAGALVRLVECAPRALRGGNARHARNLRAVHDAPTAFSPGCYTPEEFAAEAARVSGGLNNAPLGQMLAGESGSIVSWLRSHGVPFQPAGTGLLPVSRRTSFLLGGGKTLVNRLYAEAEKLGVAIDYDTRVTAMTLCGGRVAAVDLARAAGPRRLHPRSVVLCAGSASADHVSLRPHWGDAADSFINRGTPYADGALLRDLIGQGVATAGDPGACHLVAVDARSPAADGGIATRVLGIPYGIVVDRAGRRFHDEGGDTGPTRYAVWGRKVAEQPGQLAWLIMDLPALRAVPPPLFKPLCADSILGLAGVTGLHGQTLSQTADAFNAAVRAAGLSGRTLGLTPEKSRFARELAQPPFFAIPIRPGITFTCMGLRVNAETRVMTNDGGSVANLFAAGTVMAANILGNGYLAGAGLTIAMVFGRRAGPAAAAYARTLKP